MLLFVKFPIPHRLDVGFASLLYPIKGPLLLFSKHISPLHLRLIRVNTQRYHFVWEIIEEGGVLVQKIKTDDNPADMLTKVVTTIKFNHCLDLINIVKV